MIRHLKGVLAGAVTVLKVVKLLGVFCVGYCFCLSSLALIVW